MDVLKMAEAIGADAVVKKPFEVFQFVSTVERVIDARARDAAAAAAS
jgi:hypothetical protein